MHSSGFGPETTNSSYELLNSTNYNPGVSNTAQSATNMAEHSKKRTLHNYFLSFKAPFSICACFLAALIIAGIHFAFFTFLHNQSPEDTLPQAWTSTIAVILANSTRSLLGISLGVAYIQLVWHRLRGGWMTAGLVEKLLSLPWSPVDLFSPGTMIKAKLEWIFALFCILLPVVTTFPPGALKVVIREIVQVQPVFMKVPSLNLTYRSDESWNATFQAGLFTSDEHKGLADVKAKIKGLATNVLRNGEIATWKNPGQKRTERNNTYQIEFRGPRLQCNTVPDTTNITNELIRILGNETYFEPIQYFLPFPEDTDSLRGLQSLEVVVTDDFERIPSFTVYFRRNIRIPPGHYNLAGVEDSADWQSEIVGIQCLIGSSDYIVNVTHGIGDSDKFFSLSHSFKGEFLPVNDTINNDDGKGLLDWATQDTRDFVEYDYPIYGQPRQEGHRQLSGKKFSEKFFEMQSVAVALTLTDSLGGVVKNFGTYFPRTINTNILATPFAKLDPNDNGYLDFDITPERLEEALENITLSLPSLEYKGWTNRVSVTVRPWAIVYDFTKLRLILPYALVIALTFFFNIFGLRALSRNGVSAKGNSFLQIVTATSAPEFTALREKAALCSKGGEESFSDELLDLPLKFVEVEHSENRRAGAVEGLGRLQNVRSSDSTDGTFRQPKLTASHWDVRRRVWGFGTPDEVNAGR